MMFVFWVAWLAGDITRLVLFALGSFFALREFLTLSPTRQGDHRSLVLAFFVVLPLQYYLVATEHFDLFTVFIPVYVFLALPVASALANDPVRFLERNAKLQWGIMVCIYGMSHVPALMLLDFPHYDKQNAFLLLFLVLVVQTCMVTQHLVAGYRPRPPAAANISQSFHLAKLGLGHGGGQPARHTAGGHHALQARPGLWPVVRRLCGGVARASGHEGPQARPRHPDLARPGQSGHGRRRHARPHRLAVFCRAGVLSFGALVFWPVAAGINS